VAQRDVVNRVMAFVRYALLDAPGAPGVSARDYPDCAAWVRQRCRPVDGLPHTPYDCRPVP
jgi:hypothetical protein